MSVYQVINYLISQPKTYVVDTHKNSCNKTVFFSTKLLVKFDEKENVHTFTLKNCVYQEYVVNSMQV